MELTPDSWNRRYLKKETGWDIGAASLPLKTFFDTLSDKRLKILIPGGGNGYEAEYLFKNGFTRVFLLDWAAKPLEHFRKRVKDFPANHLVRSDFFKHRGKYDLIIEQTFFCAINPELRSAYARKVFDLLNDGGRLAGVLFDDKLNNDHPPFGGTRKEYRKYFAPYFSFRHFERCYNSIEPRKGRELFINLVKKKINA